MKYLLTVALALGCGQVFAQTGRQAASPDYPSCDLSQQVALKADTGGSITDPRQAHVLMRGNILQADISTARKARLLSEAKALRMWQQVDAVRRQADGLVRRQGFLSAAEVAGEDRALNAVALQMCKPPPSAAATGTRSSSGRHHAGPGHPASLLSAGSPQA